MEHRNETCADRIDAALDSRLTDLRLMLMPSEGDREVFEYVFDTSLELAKREGARRGR